MSYNYCIHCNIIHRTNITTQISVIYIDVPFYARLSTILHYLWTIVFTRLSALSGLHVHAVNIRHNSIVHIDQSKTNFRKRLTIILVTLRESQTPKAWATSSLREPHIPTSRAIPSERGNSPVCTRSEWHDIVTKMSSVQNNNYMKIVTTTASHWKWVMAMNPRPSVYRIENRVIYHTSRPDMHSWDPIHHVHHMYIASWYSWDSVRHVSIINYTHRVKTCIHKINSLLQGRHFRGAGGPSPPQGKRKKRKKKEKKEKREKKEEKKRKKRRELWITSNYYI